MSAREASWHENMAGHRAAEAARNQGEDITAVEAVADAAAGALSIAGYELRPLRQGTLWALKKLATEFAAWADARGMAIAADPENNPGDRELLELGLCVITFTDSRRVWQDLQNGRLENLIHEAENFAWDMAIKDALALQSHFQNEMTRAAMLSDGQVDEPKKKPRAQPETPSTSSVNPNPLLGVESLSSNGSWLNTESTSPPLFGTSPSPPPAPCYPSEMNATADQPAQATSPAR